ncbi:CobW family GTP-binding protein [Spirosoma sp. KUDC1026]|uniref:CobW family GTP-binding protein n=1 Tax=Spirosoma sp. KUDC1026 TaxID=2745947 RepID=UPI00159BBBA3|nr:GTP-binding protein [Spirosoma sp. KUDC1026]QKZ14733.1 GTP-binding protein [Spirosoma sp. KUDC1026]
MSSTRKPVTILTGFLGAGKTTFLNAVLAARPNTKFAIIENEFGEEGIDGELVVQANTDVVEMANGCICCSLNDGLYEVLEELYDRRDSFDELLIETTGIADPSGVAQPFLTVPSVQKTFSLKRVVCLVDAQLIEDQLRDTEEAIRQIGFSDVILLNKTDTVSPAYVQQLTELLRGLNPFAHILYGDKDNYPIDELFALERDTEPAEPVVPLFRPLSPAAANTSVQHHHHVHSDIVSLSFRFTEPFELADLQHRLTAFLLFQSQGIYRVKGIVSARDQSQKIILQSVGKNLVITKGADWPDGEERISRVVFIGKLLKPQGFEKMLRQCLSKPSTWNVVSSSQLRSTPKL